MNNVTVEVTRALRWGNETVPPGRTLKLSPADAQRVLDTGRGKLVHAADAAQCRAAARADVVAQLRAAGAMRIGTAPSPWVPIN